MYIVPRCITEEHEADAIILTSEIFDSKVRLSKKDIIEEFYRLKEKGCSKLTTELEIGLHELGILMSYEEIDKVVSDTNELLDKDLFLMIMPTDACNFRCVYCYESHESKMMSECVLEAIKKFLIKNIDKYNHISIGWFGGEPTLCRDIILEINQFVKKSVGENCTEKFYSAMTTNGYLLDIEKFKTYYESGITSYQITLDGWEHDKTRPLANGDQSLKTIIENLDEIHNLSEEYEFEILLRYNILAGNYDFSWYDYLNAKYGDDRRFTIYVRPVSDMGGENVKTLNLIEEEKISETLKKHEEYIHKLKIGLANEKINRNVVVGSGFCYAGCKNHFVIRTDGRLEKCTVALDSPENQVGYLDLDGNMHIDEEKNRRWYDFKLENKCYTCKKAFTCMNKECPLKRIKGTKLFCYE